MERGVLLRMEDDLAYLADEIAITREISEAFAERLRREWLLDEIDVLRGRLPVG